MEKLNYLRQDKKIPGKESFVTYVDFQVKDGTADMWLYDIFPGVQLNIINLRLDITHLYYPAKNSFQKSRLKRREIFTELLLYTLTTKKCP